jgi:zinc protease
VEREVAASVGGGLAATIDPYLYSIQATVRPDRTPEQALQAFDDEVARLLDHPVSAGEVAKAIKQARALFAYGSESITNQAFWLGYSEIFADYAWFETYLERIAQVTPGDVHAAAQKYLTPANRIVGIYRPTGEPSHA